VVDPAQSVVRAGRHRRQRRDDDVDSPASRRERFGSSHVAVDNVDGTVARARELGASVLVEPMDVPQVGRIAVLNDPQSATFGIIKPQPGS